jgi:hypothetical protein
VLFILTSNEHILTESWLQIVEVTITSVGMSVQDTAMTIFIILPSSNECKSLFNTCAFYCSEHIFIVNKSFIVLQDLTSFKLYHPRLYYIVVISQHLDLTLLYADWTRQEINSLTHSHLVVLSLFSIEGSSVRLGYSRNIPHSLLRCLCLGISCRFTTA